MEVSDVNQPTDRVAEFRRLHEAGCFVIPNPWDAGSARALEALGFPALATTSSGFAFSLGRLDGGELRDRYVPAVGLHVLDADVVRHRRHLCVPGAVHPG